MSPHILRLALLAAASLSSAAFDPAQLLVENEPECAKAGGECTRLASTAGCGGWRSAHPVRGLCPRAPAAVLCCVPAGISSIAHHVVDDVVDDVVHPRRDPASTDGIIHAQYAENEGRCRRLGGYCKRGTAHSRHCGGGEWVSGACPRAPNNVRCCIDARTFIARNFEIVTLDGLPWSGPTPAKKTLYVTTRTSPRLKYRLGKGGVPMISQGIPVLSRTKVAHSMAVSPGAMRTMSAVVSGIELASRGLRQISNTVYMHTKIEEALARRGLGWSSARVFLLSFAVRRAGDTMEFCGVSDGTGPPWVSVVEWGSQHRIERFIHWFRTDDTSYFNDGADSRPAEDWDLHCKNGFAVHATCTVQCAESILAMRIVDM